EVAASQTCLEQGVVHAAGHRFQNPRPGVMRRRGALAATEDAIIPAHHSCQDLGAAQVDSDHGGAVSKPRHRPRFLFPRAPREHPVTLAARIMILTIPDLLFEPQRAAYGALAGPRSWHRCSSSPTASDAMASPVPCSRKLCSPVQTWYPPRT